MLLLLWPSPLPYCKVLVNLQSLNNRLKKNPFCHEQQKVFAKHPFLPLFEEWQTYFFQQETWVQFTLIFNQDLTIAMKKIYKRIENSYFKNSWRTFPGGLLSVLLV